MEKMYKGILLTTDFTLDEVETAIVRQREIFGGEFNFLDTSHQYAEKAQRDFIKNYDPSKQFLLITRNNGKFAGTITFMGEDDGVGRLRFLIVEPEVRGIGLGKEIVSTALEWAKEMGYSHIYLTTHSVLEVARKMYASLGFVKVSEEPADEVCVGAMEERWDIDI